MKAADLPRVLDRLERVHGKPPRPLPRKALDWVLWENAAYLVPDDRRREAYLALKQATGLRAEGILALSRDELRDLAAMGGMLAGKRVEKLLAIAETVRDEFEGDLEAALALPTAKARRALKRFPGIGDPGADKILLFTGTCDLPAFESNGLRVLIRLGVAEEAKSYSTSYRSATRAFVPLVGRGGPWLRRAHDLARVHGQAVCKSNHPRCDECALRERCPSAGG